MEINKKENVKKFTHMTQHAGKYKFNLDVVSWNYRGLDLEIPFELTVEKMNPKREVKFGVLTVF